MLLSVIKYLSILRFLSYFFTKCFIVDFYLSFILILICVINYISMLSFISVIKILTDFDFSFRKILIVFENNVLIWIKNKKTRITWRFPYVLNQLFLNLNRYTSLIFPASEYTLFYIILHSLFFVFVHHGYVQTIKPFFFFFFLNKYYF